MAKEYSLNALIVKGYDVSLMALAENKVPSGYNEGPIGLLAWEDIVSIVEEYTNYFVEKQNLSDKRTALPLLREILYYRREEVIKNESIIEELEYIYCRAVQHVRHHTAYVEVDKLISSKNVRSICESEASVNRFYEETQTASRCLHENTYMAD